MEWNYQITTELERSKKMTPTNTWASWRLTPSNKCKWKTRSEKNISGERENFLRQNSPAETSSKEYILGLCHESDIRDPFSSGPMRNLNKRTKEQENYWPCIRHYTPETTLTDYMYLENREEEDLPASKSPLTHPYNDSRTT